MQIILYVLGGLIVLLIAVLAMVLIRMKKISDDINHSQFSKTGVDIRDSKIGTLDRTEIPQNMIDKTSLPTVLERRDNQKEYQSYHEASKDHDDKTAFQPGTVVEADNNETRYQSSHTANVDSNKTEYKAVAAMKKARDKIEYQSTAAVGTDDDQTVYQSSAEGSRDDEKTVYQSVSSGNIDNDKTVYQSSDAAVIVEDETVYHSGITGEADKEETVYQSGFSAEIDEDKTLMQSGAAEEYDEDKTIFQNDCTDCLTREKLNVNSKPLQRKEEGKSVVCLENMNSGQKWKLLIHEDETIIIGREYSCRICLNESSVSGKQCVIYRDRAGNPVIENKSHSNITKVNRVKLQSPQILYEGDEIQCGRIVLAVTSITPGV